MARFDELPREVVSAYGKKGCVKSAEVRREKRRMKESLNILLKMPLKPKGKEYDLEEIKSFAQLKGKNITVEQALLIAQIQKALKGDTKAMEFIRIASGQSEEEW